MSAGLAAASEERRAALAADMHVVEVAPVGEAWDVLRAEAPALWPELLWTDGFHPSPLGSLLAALVLARWLGIECQGDVGDAVRSAPGQPAIAPASHHIVDLSSEAVATVTAAAQRVWDRHLAADESPAMPKKRDTPAPRDLMVGQNRRAGAPTLESFEEGDEEEEDEEAA